MIAMRKRGKGGGKGENEIKNEKKPEFTCRIFWLKKDIYSDSVLLYTQEVSF